MESAEFAGFGDVRASLRAVCGPRWLGNWLSDCCVPNSVPVVANPEMERRNAELHRQVLSKNVAMIEKWSRLDATIRLDEDMGLASRVQSRSGAPPPVPGGERERPLKYFVVENATLKAQGRPGVSFRRSKMSTDIADTKPAAWGDVVQGVEEGDGWIRVGQYYLPTSYHGLPLVTALPTSKLRARTGGAQCKWLSTWQAVGHRSRCKWRPRSEPQWPQRQLQPRAAPRVAMQQLTVQAHPAAAQCRAVVAVAPLRRSRSLSRRLAAGIICPLLGLGSTGCRTLWQSSPPRRQRLKRCRTKAQSCQTWRRNSPVRSQQMQLHRTKIELGGSSS